MTIILALVGARLSDAICHVRVAVTAVTVFQSRERLQSRLCGLPPTAAQVNRAMHLCHVRLVLLGHIGAGCQNSHITVTTCAFPITRA